MPKLPLKQLSDVLDTFECRQWNLIDIFETRAADMEEALEPHAELNTTQRRLIGAYFLSDFLDDKDRCAEVGSFKLTGWPLNEIATTKGLRAPSGLRNGGKAQIFVRLSAAKMSA
jgi:hypothetical protein